MQQYVSEKLARAIPRLGNPTHSPDAAPRDAITELTRTTHGFPAVPFAPWPEPQDRTKYRHPPTSLDERILTLIRYPTGDMATTVVRRKVRKEEKKKEKNRTPEQATWPEEHAARAAARARRRLYDACLERKVNCLLTIAKRGGFEDLDEAWATTELVLNMLENRGWILNHVTVPELHTGKRLRPGMSGINTGKYHVHVAVNKPADFSYREMHEAVREIKRKLYGNSPENPTERMISVNVQTRTRGRRSTPAYCAAYISKYLTKDDWMAIQHHRKRYDISRGGERKQVVRVRIAATENDVEDAQLLAAVLLRYCPTRPQGGCYIRDDEFVRFAKLSAMDFGQYEHELPEALPLPTPEELAAFWARSAEPRSGVHLDSDLAAWNQAERYGYAALDRSNRRHSQNSSESHCGGRADRDACAARAGPPLQTRTTRNEQPSRTELDTEPAVW